MATFNLSELEGYAPDQPELPEDVPHSMVVQDLSAPPLPKRADEVALNAASELNTNDRNAA